MKKLKATKIMATTMAVITMATAVAPIEAQAGMTSEMHMNAAIGYSDNETYAIDGCGININLFMAEFSNVIITDEGASFTNTVKGAFTIDDKDKAQNGYAKAGTPLYNFFKDVNSVDIYANLSPEGKYHYSFTIANKGETAWLDKEVARDGSYTIKITDNVAFVNAMAITAATNQVRYENGMSKLNVVLDPTLFNTSVAKGKEMLAEGYYGHANRAGVAMCSSVGAAENLNMNSNSILSTTFIGIKNQGKARVDHWMTSTGHKAQILNANYTIMGAHMVNITNDVYTSTGTLFSKGVIGVQMFK